MGNQRDRIGRFMDVTQLSVSDKPIVEVAGDRRVLIENHCGVKEYGHERILVQVSFGYVCVMGQDLEILRMTKEQLVICGKIQCVQFLRKEDTCSF